MEAETHQRVNSLSLGRFVTIALVCYFGFVIFNANDKLQNRKIGTIFQTISVKTVKDSYIPVAFQSRKLL